MFDTKKIEAILQKAAAFGSKPTEETFSELPKVLVWMRFVVGASYGYYLGANGVRSGVMPLQAMNVIVFIPMMYLRFYLGAPQDAFASQSFFSGTFNAFALCMLIWITMFTAQHEAEESLLVQALGTVKSMAEGDIVVEEVMEEQEF